MTVETFNSPARENVTEVARRPATTSERAIVNLIDEWKESRTTGQPQKSPEGPLPVDYGIYHDQMHVDLNALGNTLQQSNPDQKALASELNQVNKDANWWQKHEASSPLNAEVGDITKDLHQQIDQAVQSLGQLQAGDQGALTSLRQSAGDIQNDLVTLEKIDWWQRHGGTGGGGGSGSGGDGGSGSGGKGGSGSGGDGGSGSGGSGSGGDGGSKINPPAGSTAVDGNLVSNPSSWLVHLGKGSDQAGIGGSGNVDNATVTAVGNNQMLYQTTGGKYGDSLIGKSIHAGTGAGEVSPDATHYQLNATFNLDSSYLKNGQMFEKDLVVTKADGKHYVIGTQINPQNGDVYFWDQKSWKAGGKGWVLEGSVTNGAALQANTNYKLELDAHVSDNQYVYDNYSLNGKSVPMTKTAFAVTQSNWGAGVVDQTQEDLRGNVPNGTTIGATLSNETLYAW